MDDASVGVVPPLNVSFKTTSGISREIVEEHGLLAEVACADTEAHSLISDLTYAVHMPFNEAPLGRLN
ncbi:MAG: hypothetical protein R6V19_17380, partial [Armatimonadota bacterium]